MKIKGASSEQQDRPNLEYEFYRESRRTVNEAGGRFHNSGRLSGLPFSALALPAQTHKNGYADKEFLDYNADCSPAPNAGVFTSQDRVPQIGCPLDKGT
ncbi:MAG TPA: hypothetical protein VFA18_18760, partial [Gemmataceae bacterium]|nr:hypothetical protein [Gemmataceae bacterium]